MNKKTLLITSAIASVFTGSYGNRSYAACTAVGSNVTCTGSSTVNTTSQSFNPLDNASITISPGFGVNAAAGSAINVTGDGALSFTDTNTLNSVDITANDATGKGLNFLSSGDDGSIAGSITISSNSQILSKNDDGIRTVNLGSGNTHVTVNGDVTTESTSPVDAAVYIYSGSSTARTDLIIGSTSTLTSDADGVDFKNYGVTSNIVVNGDMAVTDKEAMYIYSYDSITDFDLVIGSSSTITSDDDGILFENYGSGATDITVNGDITSLDQAVYVNSFGTSSNNVIINGTITSTSGTATHLFSDDSSSNFELVTGSSSNITGDDSGVYIDNDGVGSTTININGNVTSGTSDAGIYVDTEVSTQDLSLTLGSTANINGHGDGIDINNAGVGDVEITISGDVTGITGNAIDITQTAANDVNLTINESATIKSDTTTAIVTNAGKVLDMTIDSATISGNGGTAIDMNDANDSLALSGNVNFTGDIEAGAGTDTLNIGNSTVNMATGSSFLNFESVNVTGDLTSASGALVDINSTTSVNVTGGLTTDISSQSNFGKIAASNGFNFSNGANLSVTTSGRVVDIESGTVLNNVLSGGTVSGISSGVLSDDNPAYKFTSIVDTNKVGILVTKPDLANIGFGNVRAFGLTIDGIAQTTSVEGLKSVITDIVDAENNSTRKSYIKTLLPEANSAKFNVTKNIVQKNFDVVQVRMDKLRGGSSEVSGLSAGDSVKMKSSWLSLFHKDISQGYRGGEFGYDSKINGLTAGIDFNYSDNTIIGGGFSYASGDTSTRVLGSKSKVDSQNLMLYATHNFKNNLYLNLLASAGLSQVEATRKLFDGTISLGEYEGYQLSSEAKLGYSLQFDNLNLIPYLSAKYNYVSFEDYNERGGSAPLSVDSTDIKSFESEIGVEVRKTFSYKNVSYSPNILIGWRHDFINDDIKKNVSFAAQPSTNFSSTSNTPGRDLLNLGGGLDVTSNENIDVSLDYNLEAKEDFKAHSFIVNAKINF